MKGRTWITHDMLFCLCGWEEDAFLNVNDKKPDVQKMIRQHRKTCNQSITREQARVFKYPAV